MVFEKHRRQTRPTRSFWRKLFPFLRWWNFIGWDTARADFLAGLTGAVVALPQGMAYAMIAGLPPEYGLYSAIVVLLVAALFGSSLHLISGPTTAISIVIFASLGPMAEPGSFEFIRLALTLTFLTGAFQLALGLARMGTLVNFVSHSVVVGFTAGAAILIATSQFRHVLGLPLQRGEPLFIAWINTYRQIDMANPYALMVAIGSLGCAALCKFFRPRWPNLLLAMIIGSLLCAILGAESRGIQLMGGLPAHLPRPSLPDFSVGAVQQLMPKALAVALIGLIEALSIARSIATYSRQQIDSNQEFIGQGLSNVVGSFFSSYAGSGSFTRSAINYQAGAMTPLSAVFSAVFLTLILMLAAPLTAYLPIAAVGGVILLVAFTMINLPHIRSVFRTSKEETAVLLTTFLATLLLDLEFAIYAGVLLSLVLYLSRTSRPEIVHLRPDPDVNGRFLSQIEPGCPAFKIIRIDGSLFFGAVNHIMEFLYNIDKDLAHKSTLLIVAYGINFIDQTGAEMLANETRRRRRSRGDLYLCGLKQKAKDLLERGGYIETIGADHIFFSETEAVAAILAKIENPECRRCRSPLFSGCKNMCNITETQ